MFKVMIIGVAAFGYVHYVHIASQSIASKLDNFKQVYTEPNQVLDQYSAAHLTSQQK